jgi:hypothetical protein
MSAPDISREACERLSKLLLGDDWASVRSCVPDTAALILALRAALDAAERERDDWRQGARAEAAIADTMKAERDAAAATGYARGVKDAAGVCEKRLISRSYGSHADAYEYAMNAILALLPKEKTDAR